MNDEKTLLLRLGASLYRLGIKVEKARQRLRALANNGVSYDSEEMLEALQELQTLDSQYKSLEAQYLELRKEITLDSRSVLWMERETITSILPFSGRWSRGS